MTGDRTREIDRATPPENWRLRFAGALEQEFRDEHREEVLMQRLLLLLIGAILVACMPFVDAWLLNPPDEYILPARRVEFGFILPALLLAFAFNADRRLRKWSDTMGLVALFVVVSGWSYLRHLGAEFGYDVPTLLIGVVLAGAFALAGLFFWAVAPVATLGLVVFATLEVWTRGPSVESLFNILAIMLLALITALGGYLQEQRARSNWWQRHQLREISLQDALTGLSNYRAFQNLYGPLYAAAAAERYPLLVIELDIDYFKHYNDRYGHLQGDECLRRVASVLGDISRRSSDVVARTGGEEFTLVTNAASPVDAQLWLDALLQRVRDLEIPHEGHPELSGAKVTISVGAAWGVPDDRFSPHSMLRLADEQLYLAKRGGRDRVTMSLLDPAAEVPATARPRLHLVRAAKDAAAP